MRETIPASEISSIIDNIGLPYSSINMAYSNSAPIGTMDADVLVTLKPGHRPSDSTFTSCAASCRASFLAWRSTSCPPTSSARF